MTIFKCTILEHFHNHSSLLSSPLIDSWRGHTFETPPRYIEAKKLAARAISGPKTAPFLTSLVKPGHVTYQNDRLDE